MKLIITDLENFNISVDGEYKVIKPQKKINHCLGCFDCWLKTPGECIIHDGYERTGCDMGKCDELIIISECCYGSVSPFVKAVQDRAISYIHPDFVIRKGEMHHKRRYTNKIAVSAYYYGENITADEKATAEKIVYANADNYDATVKKISFYKNVKELEDVSL